MAVYRMKKTAFLIYFLLIMMPALVFCQKGLDTAMVAGAEKGKGLVGTPEQQLLQLGISLPTAPSPAANYVNCVRVGNLLFLAGKGPSRADGTLMKGKLGRDLSIDSGYVAARLTAISHIAVLKAELGSLSKVKRIVKVLGMINCVDSFYDQSKVMNGYSDLMVAVFGEKGKHVRSSVGMCSLPQNIAVEVEIVVEIEDSAVPVHSKGKGSKGPKGKK